MNLEQVKKLNLPTTPGSYQYYDKAGKIIYVGKAANLKSRVLSYWSKSAELSGAKQSMLTKIAKIKWIEVGSEIEALLLEANLIKKYQPDYNIIMRDDKRHLYIKITNDEWPKILTTRTIGVNLKKTIPPNGLTHPVPSTGHPSQEGNISSGRYFGPFTSGGAVRETIKAIAKIFPYGRFATMPDNKNSQIKNRRYPEIYGAPTDIIEYKKIIKEIIAFLEGRRKDIEKNFQSSIINLQKKLLTDTKPHTPRPEYGPPLSRGELISEKIRQLKYRLLQMRNVLAHSNVLSVHEKYAADVVELAKILALPKIPQRIEGYDISNLFGQEAVGSMVVFKNGEPDKSQYRKFKIKSSIINDQLSISKGDDTGMLKEILERRFNNNWPLPDLIIIDGGKGQLNAGLAILKKFKLDIPILGVSKGDGLRSAKAPDRIFFPKIKKPLVLPLASPALHIIKRVRDEAHRFAITFHKQRRDKKTFQK
ncbi:MAG: GIY-YIG nuclease family protein [Patescibacteria group bacterium]|jgi:excinuclease ABC subunit C